VNIDNSDTAVVFIDPQNEVLSEKGLAWPLVRESLRENHTIENMESIFKAAKARGFEVFISPHYFYPTDKGGKFNGALVISLERFGRHSVRTERIDGCRSNCDSRANTPPRAHQ